MNNCTSTSNTPEQPKEEQKNEKLNGWDVAEILSEATDLVGGIIGSGIEAVTDVVSLLGE